MSPQLRGQIRGDLRLPRRPRLSIAPGARCRLILAAGRSPVPPRDVVGSSWGRSGRTHRHLASPIGAGLFVRELSAGPAGVAGRKAGKLPGLLKRRASRRHRTGARGRHRRCGTGDRDGRRGCSPGACRQSGQFPGAPAAQGPAGWSRRHGRGGAVSGRLRPARQRCLPQPCSGLLASALPGPSTSVPRGVGSAGGTISSGVRGVAADLPVLAGRSL